MCGIIGYVGKAREGQWRQTHELLTAMLEESLVRGRDASGFAALTSSLDRPRVHKAITAKAPLPADEFVRTNRRWRQLLRLRCCSVVGHVRAATHGSPGDNRNNHPFEGRIEAGRFALVHNGIFANPREVADRLSFPLHTQCDSEAAKGLIEAIGSFPQGVYRCLTELQGSMALAVLDYRTGTVWLARDAQRPLWICRLADGRRTVFASTAEIIARAVERTLGRFSDAVESLHPLAAGYVHGLTRDGRLIAPYTEAARLAAWWPKR